jgi:formylglycine-generating enzyme required for sulfatase activity
MDLVPLPAGAFAMGTPRPRQGAGRADEAEHPVRFSRPFLIGAHEVTQDEYRKVMKADPSWFSPAGGGKAKVTGFATGAFPVERVTWFDALAFCNRLSEMDGYPPYYRLDEVKTTGDSITGATIAALGGNGYRLPTEAEWEYACRARTFTAYHFGNLVRTGKEGNFKTIISGGYGGPDVEVDLGRTARVGSYPPNAWGLYDMHGNVAEWCWDWYGPDYYVKSPEVDPTGPAGGTQRVCRGGSWLVSYQNCRSATRHALAPDEAKDHTGFRVARTP